MASEFSTTATVTRSCTSGPSHPPSSATANRAGRIFNIPYPYTSNPPANPTAAAAVSSHWPEVRVSKSVHMAAVPVVGAPTL